MFTEDYREACSHEKEAGSVIRDSSEEDIIFVIHNLIEQNSELISKLEEASYLERVAQEQIAESARQRDILRMEAAKIMAEAQQLADKTFRDKVLLAEQTAKQIIELAEAKAEATKTLAEQEARRIIDEARQMAGKERHSAQENKNEVGVETRTTEVIASGESSDKFSTDKEQEACWQRYIWDSAKLAWVEAGEVDFSQPLRRFPAVPDIPEEGKSPILPNRSMSTKDREVKEDDEKVKRYKGPVGIVVKSHPMSGELRKFSKHLRNLKSAYDVRLLKVDSSGKDIIIQLFLKSPIPLLDILKALPGVHTAQDDLKIGRETQRSRFKQDKTIATTITVKLTG